MGMTEVPQPSQKEKAAKERLNLSWAVCKGRFQFLPDFPLREHWLLRAYSGILPFSESVKAQGIPILKNTFPAAKQKYSSSSVCGHHFRVLMLKLGPQETTTFLHKYLWFHINFKNNLWKFVKKTKQSSTLSFFFPQNSVSTKNKIPLLSGCQWLWRNLV